MFMNRWLLRHEIVELNELNTEEQKEVFAVLKPILGEGGKERFLESEADAVIGSVRGGRPPVASGLYFGAEEDRTMTNFNGAVEPFERIADGIDRLIEVLSPKTAELVGTDYIASKIGKSKQWIGKMAEKGTIPKNCIAPKISGGRIWKFHRDKIDAWLNEHRGR